MLRRTVLQLSAVSALAQTVVPKPSFKLSVREEQHKSIVEGLKFTHDLVAPHRITLIVEPLNTLVDHHGYYLNHTPEAFQIMREVDSPYVKILFDIYHVQIMDGNLIDTIRKNIAWIDHFHVGDVPGRH